MSIRLNPDPVSSPIHSSPLTTAFAACHTVDCRFLPAKCPTTPAAGLHAVDCRSSSSPDVPRKEPRPARALRRPMCVAKCSAPHQPFIAGSPSSAASPPSLDLRRQEPLLHGTADGYRPRDSPPPPVVAPPGILPPSKPPVAPSRLAHRCSVHRPSVGSSGQRIPPLLVSIVV